MNDVQVNPVGVELLQAGFTALEDVAARKPGLRDGLAGAEPTFVATTSLRL